MSCTQILISVIILNSLQGVTEGLECSCSTCEEGHCSTNGSCIRGKFLLIDETTYHVTQKDESACTDFKMLEGPFDVNLCNEASYKYIMAWCCNDTDFCNRRFEPKFSTTALPLTASKPKRLAIGMTVLGALLILALWLVLVVFIALRYGWNPPPCLKRVLCKQCVRPTSHIQTCDECDTEMTLTSGSGHGLPLLAERTISREVKFVELVGRGRYGAVWRAEWRNTLVAVKIFDPVEDNSWRREVDIYETHMLRHDNILHFIAADSLDKGAYTQLLLITQFHEKGSLFDYLSGNTLDIMEALTVALSIVNGLCYLHIQIKGTTEKPMIAHRDLKSKNILVKDDGTCCIADLGLAVRENTTNHMADITSSNRVGTIRYMPPEVIDDSIDKTSVNRFKEGDIYSLGLIYWEILTRCKINGVVDAYNIPYHDVVSSDPSLEEMKKVVCVNQYRPTIPQRLVSHKVMYSLVSWIKECWHPNASVRLTARRVQLNIQKLLTIISSSPQSEIV